MIGRSRIETEFPEDQADMSLNRLGLASDRSLIAGSIAL